ncbi:MAG: hypothetical protein OXI91_00085 [Chloroflexota bacterium]|nr:hypothetical protein [Chloroflexota bacterium]
MPELSVLSLNVKKALNFLDEKPESSLGNATAIVSVLGEDLGAATFQHCLEANGAGKVLVRTEPVGTGKRKGPLLDRWIEADFEGKRYLFQTEIKSWSAHAIGGKKVSLCATRAQLLEEKRRNWGKVWDPINKSLSNKLVAKVLVPMKPPKDAESREILPLLIFWYPIGLGSRSQGRQLAKGGHLFSIPNPTAKTNSDVFPWPEHGDFPELWVFSVSSYLRSLRKEVIELEMPQASARLRALTRMVRIADG